MQVLLHEPSPPLASMNNQLMLKELKCAVCSNILSQPPELLCGTLVCAKCLKEWIAASVNCPCCSEGGPLVSPMSDQHQSSPRNHSCLLTDCENATFSNAENPRHCQWWRSISSYSKGGPHPDLSDEERRSLLDKAGISSSIELGAAEVLAIKAGLAIPWNKLRLLRRYVTRYSKAGLELCYLEGQPELLITTARERCHRVSGDL
eukprot:Em0001g3368a